MMMMEEEDRQQVMKHYDEGDSSRSVLDEPGVMTYFLGEEMTSPVVNAAAEKDKERRDMLY